MTAHDPLESHSDIRILDQRIRAVIHQRVVYLYRLDLVAGLRLDRDRQ